MTAARWCVCPARERVRHGEFPERCFRCGGTITDPVRRGKCVAADWSGDAV